MLKRVTGLEYSRNEKDDLVTDSLITLARRRKHFSQLSDGLGVSDVRHTEIHTAEALMPEPSDSGVGMAIDELKRDISPGIEQNPAELIKTGCRKIRHEIHKLVFFNLELG